MATKRDLLREIDWFNKKYCKGRPNKFALSEAYGGYQVVLTGKKRKDGHYYKGSLGSGAASITNGYDSPSNTLNDLYRKDSKGWILMDVKAHDDRSRGSQKKRW